MSPCQDTLNAVVTTTATRQTPATADHAARCGDRAGRISLRPASARVTVPRTAPSAYPRAAVTPASTPWSHHGRGSRAGVRDRQ